MTFSFIVYAMPKGKGRPRFRVTKRKDQKKPYGVQTYTPDATADLEKIVRLACYEAMDKANIETPFQGPLKIDLIFFMPIAKSWRAAKKEEARFGRIAPVSRPDWDNLGKLVCDALNQVLYTDDAQIVEARVRKLYADIPRIEVTIEPWEGL